MVLTAHNPARFRDLFHKEFPYLKIEFFNEEYDHSKGSPAATLRHSSGLNKPGELVFNIYPEMTVGEFEEVFYAMFRLPVQVFRRSGKIWLETTTTDAWTLKEQNRYGERSCKPLKNRRDEAADFREQL